MKRKFKVISTALIAIGLIVGWNLQNKPAVEALLNSNTFVTRSTSGGSTNGSSLSPSISHDGRYVVFESGASNLISSDTNSRSDIFLKDTANNTIQRISVDSSGNQANDSSNNPTISGDGKYVVYTSNATNLVSGDTNGVTDIFRYNVATGATERVSIDSSGTEGNNSSYSPDTDTQGRFVVFDTWATNLTSVTDTNSTLDVVLKDMSTGSTTLISQSDTGLLGNADSGTPKISCDGRFVVFYSGASNLTSDTNNGWYDIFLTDLLSSRTVQNITNVGDHSSTNPYISCDGNYIAFSTRASNLGVNPNTTPYSYDILRYNRLTAAFDGVSVKENGAAPTGNSSVWDISSDGRYVIFSSNETSFVNVSNDVNTGHDLFLRDMNGIGFRIITLAAGSSNTGNNQSNSANSYGPEFSGTNRIVFPSPSTNLVSGVTDTTQSDIFMVDVGTPNTCTF